MHQKAPNISNVPVGTELLFGVANRVGRSKSAPDGAGVLPFLNKKSNFENFGTKL